MCHAKTTASFLGMPCALHVCVSTTGGSVGAHYHASLNSQVVTDSERRGSKTAIRKDFQNLKVSVFVLRFTNGEFTFEIKRQTFFVAKCLQENSV